MSPRAAWRLETIGFTKVYDYVGGKADWFAAGLPREGLLAEVPRAGDAARQGDVTCRIDERAEDVLEKLRAAATDFGFVTTDGGVVLGRVRGRDLVGDEGKTVEVLPPGEYQDEHIQGAVNLPLKNLDRDSASHFDQNRPTIVY